MSRGHRLRTKSDTEVVLRGYLEWSEDVVDKLNGMFDACGVAAPTDTGPGGLCEVRTAGDCRYYTWRPRTSLRKAAACLTSAMPPGKQSRSSRTRRSCMYQLAGRRCLRSRRTVRKSFGPPAGPDET
ncbi:hypothetical protein [Streptomyces sp. NBC_00442]|uniref:hypothetical protein n=1 Tax=Streptomyces sp. NBC_00442 TaxID=2903651 RepID=UPI002E1BDD3B